MNDDALDVSRQGRIDAPTREHADLLQTLAAHRGFLMVTARGLTEEQARQQSTVSVLTVGGIIKHVTHGEQMWTRFIEGGAERMYDGVAESDWADGFRLTDDETLAGALAEYEQTAQRTTDLVRSLPDLDIEHPLPEAPWFEPGASWSARRVLVHLIAETAQHAGHADIIRETIDGSRTMG